MSQKFQLVVEPVLEEFGDGGWRYHEVVVGATIPTLAGEGYGRIAVG